MAYRFFTAEMLNSLYNGFVPVRRMASWTEVPLGPPDVIFGISEAYNRDKNTKKVNVGVGAYRTNEGTPLVLQCVRAAEDKIKVKKMNKEYQPIIGQQEFRKAAVELALGKDSPIIKNGLLATVQCISGTGGLRLGGDFITKFYKGNKTIFLPDPTWGNHIPLFKICGMNVEKYAYYDSKTVGFDFNGCIDSINKISEKSVILFHAVAHNPTGIDPNEEQWKEISAAVKKRQLLPFFDMAYQGFASGNIEKDAFAVMNTILHTLICTSKKEKRALKSSDNLFPVHVFIFANGFELNKCARTRRTSSNQFLATLNNKSSAETNVAI